MQRTLHLMCGLPGSGKSTAADWLAEREGAAIVCPDDIRVTLTGMPHCPGIENVVWQMAKDMTAAMLLRRPVIVDATNTTRRARARWLAIAKQVGVGVHCHAMDTPLATCKEQNQRRENPAPESVIDRMDRQFEIPNIKEGFSRVTFETFNQDPDRPFSNQPATLYVVERPA